MLFTRLVVGILALSSFAFGCSRKRAAAIPQAAQPVATVPTVSGVSDDDAERRRREEAERLGAERGNAREVLQQRVHFAYDLAALDAEARAALDAKASVLQRYRDVRVVIEGHADERGSVEYNLALGQRRSESAKRYLVEYGVASARMETTSLGEERPLDPAQNERAWARNRRAEFRPVSGELSP
jgi:peptidoglycan-associated lipoprotein